MKGKGLGRGLVIAVIAFVPFGVAAQATPVPSPVGATVPNPAPSPLGGERQGEGSITVTFAEGKVSVNARNADLLVVLKKIAETAGIAIEVKSGRARDGLPGIGAFSASFKVDRTLLVGGDGVPLNDFLSRPAEEWVKG